MFICYLMGPYGRLCNSPDKGPREPCGCVPACTSGGRAGWACRGEEGRMRQAGREDINFEARHTE